MDISSGMSIVVGEPFFLNLKGAAEGVYFEYRGGHGFLIFYLSNPTPNEIAGAKGGITIGLYRKDEVIIVECYSEICGYTDAPYSCRLAKDTIEQPMTATVDVGMPLTIAIVDENNILRYMRLATLSSEFTNTFGRMIMAQKNMPFDRNAYNSKVDEIFSRYTSEQLFKKCEVTYTLGDM